MDASGGNMTAMEGAEQSGPSRIEIFAGLKNEIIEQGLSVRTPEELAAFQERLSQFVTEENAPAFLRWEALNILKTQTKSADVRAVVSELTDRLREQQTELSAQDRIAEAEDMARFAAELDDPERVEEMVADFEAFLDSISEEGA